MIPAHTEKLVLAGVLLAGVIAAGAIVGVATHSEDTTKQGFKAYSEDPESGEAKIPKPGATQAVEIYAVPARFSEPDPTGAPYNIPGGVEVQAHFVKVHTANPITNCSTSNAKTAGLDRGNDDPNRISQTGGLAQALESFNFREASKENDPGPLAPDSYDKRYAATVDLFEKDDFAGEPVYLNTNGTEDELVVALTPCVKMPDQEGWYRTWAYANGTVEKIHDDQYADQFQKGQEVEVWEPSLWYPVCECDVIRHVPMRLGPPPGSAIGDTDGSKYFPNGTLYVATGGVASDGTIDFQGTTVSADQVTSEAVQFDDGTMELAGPVYFGDMQGSEGTIREDGTVVAADGTEYPPEDQGSAPDNTGEATATSTTTAVETNEDSTPASTDDASTETETGSSPVTATESTGSAEETVEGQTTPTAQDGAGLGAAAAIAALAVGLGVLRRRRRR